MTLFTIAQLVVNILMLLGVVFLLPTRTRLNQLKDNEIAHLSRDIQALHDAILRVELKLDEHLRWHLNQ